MKFKTFLREQAEHALLNVRPVKADELKMIKEAKALASLIHTAINQKPSTVSVESIKHLNDEFKKFTSFSFLKPTIEHIDQLLDSHEKTQNVHHVVSANIDKIKHHNKQLMKMILSSDFKNATVHKGELDAILDQTNHNVDAPKATQQHLTSNYTEKPSLFGSNALLDYLGDEEYTQIANIDVSKPLYTFIDFPTSINQTNSSFWQFIMYFMLNLKTSTDPVSFTSAHKFRTYLKVHYVNDQSFIKLKETLNNYLLNNNKDLIPKILSLIDEIPSIKTANDKRRAQIKHVYRGLGFGEDDTPSVAEIKAQDKRNKYVATSMSKSTAENFALQRGHLETERRSNVGYIISYEVNAESVLLDTEIIDTIFDESEVIIDANKAIIQDIHRV